MKTNALVNTSRWTLLAGLVVAGLAAPMASGAPYTLEQKNFIAMGEAAVMIRSEMQTVYTPTGDSLPLMGSFDASGWTLDITGSMGGQAVNYTATGTYDAGTQKTSYTAGGTVGSDTWTGGGFTSFFDVFTDINLETLFSTADNVKDVGGAAKGKPDRENQTAKTYKTVGNEIIGTGEYYKTIDGVIVAGPFTQTVRAPIGDGRATIQIDDAVLTATITSGSVSGQLVPEPSAAVLVGIITAVNGRRPRRSGQIPG